jgi:hypothetical protein
VWEMMSSMKDMRVRKMSKYISCARPTLVGLGFEGGLGVGTVGLVLGLGLKVAMMTTIR